MSGKLIATVTLFVLLGTALLFLGWDLRGGRQLLIDSLQAPSRTASRIPPPADAASSGQPGQPALEALKAEVTQAEKQLDIDEKRLDALRSRAADIQLFVTILLGLGTLYAAAQAVFAYFNVQTAVKNAREEMAEAIKTINAKGAQVLTDLHKDWEDFQAACRKQFPRFMGMESVMASVFAELSYILATIEVATNVFDELSPERRQKVFFCEKSLAGLEYLQLQESPEDLLKVFRGLAVFYVAKYESDQRRNAGSEADLDRGEFYFGLALRSKRDDYRILNDQGRIESLIRNKPDEAESLWRRSIALQPHQQRAYYNLGTSNHERGKYTEAISALERGLEHSKWEDKPNWLNEGNMHYNLACALCRMAEEKPEPAYITKALGALKAATKLNPKLTTDIPADRDLQILVSGENGEAELFSALKI